MAVEFDGVNKLILILSGTTSINVKNDIYSPWKQWSLTGSNLEYEQALRAIGGDPTVSGQFLGSTFFMLNDWRIRSWEGTHELTINGNLYVDGGGNPFIPPTGSYTVTYTRVVSNLVDAVGSANESTSSFTAADRTTLDNVNTSVNRIVDAISFEEGTILNNNSTYDTIYTTLSSHVNNHYNNDLIGIKSGSTYITRRINKYTQYEGTFQFLKPLDFIPTSGTIVRLFVESA